MSNKTKAPKSKHGNKTKIIVARLGLATGLILLIFSIIDFVFGFGIIMRLACSGVKSDNMGCGFAALMMYGCMFIAGVTLTIANGIWIRIIKTP